MDPNRFLAQAWRLLEQDKTPEGYRSAISRAYYAAFHVACQFLATIDISVRRDASGHTDAYQYLSNSKDAEMERAGNSLDDLRTKRNQADYRMSEVGVEKEKTATALVNQASEIIVAVGECRRERQRMDAVKTAIKAWQRQAGRNGH